MVRILIVDDSIFQRSIISAPLKLEGHEIIEATDGQNAIEKISKENPDLIILDILMPIMDGIEVLKELQHLQNNIPVIMLTADIQDTTKNECLTLGAKAFINKPVKGKELIPVINSVLPELS